MQWLGFGAAAALPIATLAARPEPKALHAGVTSNGLDYEVHDVITPMHLGNRSPGVLTATEVRAAEARIHTEAIDIRERYRYAYGKQMALTLDRVVGEAIKRS